MPENKRNPNQPELFVENEHSGELIPNSEAAQPAITVDVLDDPNPGPAVNIFERNAHMQNMLKRFGVMSRAGGIQSDMARRRIESDPNYDNPDRLIGGAINRGAEKDLEAKHEFAKAFGLQAIISSGLMSEDEAKKLARRTYNNEIIPKFADAKGRKSRDAMKSWLNYQERKLTGKRTRRPKAPLPKNR